MSMPIIIWDTGANEAWIAGTRNSLAGFANAILKHLESPGTRSEHLGVAVSEYAVSLTDPSGDVSFDGILVFQSEDQYQELIRQHRLNYGGK